MNSQCKYDYGARLYAPVIGRFGGVDPIAEQFPHVSVFNYAENEPVGHIDLWGLQAWNVNNKWNNEYIQKYRTQLRGMVNTLENIDAKFTCEDLALDLLVTFAKDNQLPFKWETGSQSFDASSEGYDDFNKFKTDIEKRTGARDFARDANTSVLGYEEMGTGDVAVLTAEGRKNPNHIQVISMLHIDEGVLKGYNAVQGNFNWLGRLGSNNPESFKYMGTPIQKGYYSKDLDYWHNLTQKKVTYNFFQSHYSVQYRGYNFRTWNQ